MISLFNIFFMSASKRLFNDMREVEDYPPFDHHKRFCEKVKENWLTTDDFRCLIDADIIKLTKALIDKKMDSDYLADVMKMIDKIEPKWLKSSEYLLLIYKSPLGNMKRVSKKYDNINYFINKTWLFDLNTEIMKKERIQKGSI